MAWLVWNRGMSVAFQCSINAKQWLNRSRLSIWFLRSNNRPKIMVTTAEVHMRPVFIISTFCHLVLRLQRDFSVLVPYINAVHWHEKKLTPAAGVRCMKKHSLTCSQDVPQLFPRHPFFLNLCRYSCPCWVHITYQVFLSYTITLHIWVGIK